MSHRGNRPDCAYFLLISIALAAFFIAMGGVCTYVAYWPDAAFSHYQIHQHKFHGKHGEDPQMAISTYDAEKAGDKTAEENMAMKVLGPMSLALGFLILGIVGVYAVKYKCDHEPEPNIAFLRLASEMSLNFDPERKQYELMLTPCPLPHKGLSSSSEEPAVGGAAPRF